MRYLGLALYAEGPTDYRFLSLLLHRLTDALCVEKARELVDVSEVFPLTEPGRFKEEDRATRILEAARESWRTFNILFVHTDGGGDPATARQERVEPAAQRIREELSAENEGVVAVLPVRETEAWALADGEAVREAFGCTLDDAALGLPPHALEVEWVLDPKQVLEQAYAQVVGRRRPKRKASHYLEAISQRLRLGSLRQLPAFKHLETELSSALVDLGFLIQP